MKLWAIFIILTFISTFFITKSFLFLKSNNKQLAQKLLKLADIEIDGARAEDMIIHNENFYDVVLNGGSLALGESYINGWWDCKALDKFIYKILNADLYDQVTNNWSLLFSLIKSKIFNLQSKSRAFEVGQKHYDIGNNLFKNMLDKRMTYSCAYWSNGAENLDQAQEAKLDLICKKLYLKPGMKVLDIGCGWGSFAKFAAEKYNITVVGVTVSKEQAEYAKKDCGNLPVEIRLQDYRDINNTGDKFDRIVSIGMFEHVGHKNYNIFIETAYKALKDNGLFLLHTIGANTTTTAPDPWITKYIFPNGMLPSATQITSAIENLFIIEDWHNFGANYDKTLMCWAENFDKNWDKIKSQYDNRFYRMWKYYLLTCAGLFRARQAQLWQIVLSKKGIPNGYISVR